MTNEMEHVKVGQTDLNPDRIVQATFGVDDGSQEATINGVLLPTDRQPEQEDYVVAIQEGHDDEGTPTRRYLKLRSHLMESRHTVMEFYDSHEQLVKGAGGVAVAGTIV